MIRLLVSTLPFFAKRVAIDAAKAVFMADDELRHLRAQVDELQAANTALVEERRTYDRRALVRSFFTVAGQAIGERPAYPDESTFRFRLRLIAEEFVEVIEEAFDEVDGPWLRHELAKIITASPMKRDLAHLMKELEDLDYVVEGCRVACGVDGRPIAAAVHKSNMAKAGGPKRPDDGKLLKPDGWQPPDVEGELRRQGYASSETKRAEEP